MAALSTPAAVVNAAIQLVGGFNDDGPITGTPPNFDGSAYGRAAGTVYDEVVQAVGRSWGYDFSRNQASLGAATANVPALGFAYEYVYPANGIQIRQILPGAGADPNNPLPLTWDVGFATVGGTATKVLWCNVAAAAALITGTPPESVWDPLFQEAVVRELAAKLAMANLGKPDLMKQLGEDGDAAQAVAQIRDN
jgi:hypothetical protein